MILNIDRVVLAGGGEVTQWMASQQGKVAFVASVGGQRILLEMTSDEAKEMCCAGIVAAATAAAFAAQQQQTPQILADLSKGVDPGYRIPIEGSK